MNAPAPGVGIPAGTSVASPVLVIDDSLTIRKLLEMTLQRAGHAIEVAALGRDGVALARRVRPKLILLDYVLPDLKGTEVCDELDRDPLTTGVPVVIMSGKGDDIRPLFKGRKSVVEVVAKPFAPAEILHVINRALIRAPAQVAVTATATAPVPGTHTFHAQPGEAHERTRRETGARILFSAMRERLARIPEWTVEAGAQPLAPFLARRLLTPEVIGVALDGLAPLFAQPVVAAASQASAFSGSTSFLPLLSILRMATEAHRTGVLRFGDAEDGVEAWFDRGEWRLAAPCGLAAGQRILHTAGIAIEPGRVISPLSEVAPAIALVVAAGAGPAAVDALQRGGRQALLQLVAAGPQVWRWQDLPTLPDAVERCARPLTVDQLSLERLRLVDDWSQIELDVRSLDQVCARTPEFRQRLGLFTLTAEETRVLLLVDGRTAVKDMLSRLSSSGTPLSTFEVFHILYRLIQVRLISSGPGATAEPIVGIRTVVLGTDRSDDASLAGPLAAWLGRRGDGLELAPCTPDALVARLLSHGARLVLLDLADETQLVPTVQAIRTRMELSDLRLAVVVERHDRERQRGLTAAGCDRVLLRPVHQSSLDRLLTAGREPATTTWNRSH